MPHQHKIPNVSNSNVFHARLSLRFYAKRPLSAPCGHQAACRFTFQSTIQARHLLRKRRNERAKENFYHNHPLIHNFKISDVLPSPSTFALI